MATAPTGRTENEAFRLYLPGLAFATYRECLVHLRQLGVEVRLELRTEPVFDSHLDQVECLAFSPPVDADDCSRLASILLFYLERFRRAPDTREDIPKLVQGERVVLLEGIDLRTLQDALC